MHVGHIHNFVFPNIIVVTSLRMIMHHDPFCMVGDAQWDFCEYLGTPVLGLVVEVSNTLGDLKSITLSIS